jgi:cysteine desulfurase/selenocysteine lyase
MTAHSSSSIDNHLPEIHDRRRDFPILAQEVHGKPLIYFDNAATSQKPQSVINAIHNYYAKDNANIRRGVHALSERSSLLYDGAREKVRAFLNARDSREIVFVRGTTEGINFLAHSLGEIKVNAGDEVLITTLEHHSNIVPWQLLCERKNATLRVVPITDDGEIMLEEFDNALNDRTRIVSTLFVSNSLGVINPVAEIIERAHQRGIPVILDGAQSTPHMAIDVQKLGCDFYVFSGHKLYGPTGIGVVYGRSEHLDLMPPFLGGGDMIKSVSFTKTIYNDPPHRFEAGTPNIAGVVGLGAAIDYLKEVGMANINHYENQLSRYAHELLSKINGIKIIGPPQLKAPIISFVLDDIHPHDIGTILDSEGIAIRAGHHCTQPLLHRLGLTATARVSLSFYNTREELDVLATAINKVKKIFN